MRKMLLFVCFLGTLACKKNGDGGVANVAISKQYLNNILISEWTYTAEGRKASEKSYNEQTGVFSYKVEFEYDSIGRLIKEKQYGKENNLSAIVSYYWKSGDRLEKHEYRSMSGADSGKVTVRVRYDYDNENRISNQSWVDLVTDQVYNSRELKYYSNNNLRTVEDFSYYGGPPELNYRQEFIPAGETLLPGYRNRGGYIIDFRWPDFVAGEMHAYMYNGGMVAKEFNTIYSNRQYDHRGYLKSQTATIKNIKPAAPDKQNEYRYEYTEL